MPIVELPARLRAHSAGKPRVSVEAKTVREALVKLGLPCFLDDGRLKRTLGVFVGEDDVRDTLDRSLRSDEVIVIVGAMAGG